MKECDVHQTVGEVMTSVAGVPRVDIAEALAQGFGCSVPESTANEPNQQARPATEHFLSCGKTVAPQLDAPRSIDLAEMSLSELVDHIVMTHHDYLHEELPRLARMAKTVAALHGARDPRLHQVRDTFGALALELSQHMLKEETCLFPKIRHLDASNAPPALHGLMLASPIRQMESEHGDADSALERLRELSDGFSPPEWACDTYRSLLAALCYFEKDMRAHIYKENDVLFPRALDLEAAVSR